MKLLAHQREGRGDEGHTCQVWIRFIIRRSQLASACVEVRSFGIVTQGFSNWTIPEYDVSNVFTIVVLNQHLCSSPGRLSFPKSILLYSNIKTVSRSLKQLYSVKQVKQGEP